jgi:hypothetical protein
MARLQTKGIFSFPRCAKQFQWQCFEDLHNFFYSNNRFFLPPDHKFRNHLKNQFDGKVENRGPPLIMGPGDLLKKYEDTELKAWEYLFD